MTGLDGVQARLDAWAENFMANLLAAAQDIADLLQAYAKYNHPWQNRSYDTFESIKGEVVEVTQEMILVSLHAGMTYDVFLETAHGGKWAWLWPTMMANIDAIREILKRRLGRSGVTFTVAAEPA